MDNIIARIAAQTGLSNAHIELAEAVLIKDTSCLQLRVSCERALLPEENAALQAALEAELPMRISLTCTERERAVSAPEAANTAERSAAPVKTAACEKPAQNGASLLLGKPIAAGRIKPLSELSENSASITVRGQIVSFEAVEPFARKQQGPGPAPKPTYRVLINLTDKHDSIGCTCLFFDPAKRDRFMSALSEATDKRDDLLLRGVCKFSNYNKELQIFANDVTALPPVLRMDASEEKRVELHLHTKMSTMDGVTDITDAFKTAKRFGHKALAITDHGVVQSFPKAAALAKKTGVRAIFGVEGYLVPDTVEAPSSDDFVVFDIETTGLKPEHAEIIEIGAVRIARGAIIGRFSTFVNDGVVIPPEITKLTRITNDMIAGAPSLRDVLRDFIAFSEGAHLVAHNASFDVGFLRYHGERYGCAFSAPYADTLMLGRYLLHDLPNHKLDTLCAHFNIDISGHHRAVDDAEATSTLFLRLLELLAQRGITHVPLRVDEPKEQGAGKHKGHKTKSNHITILARTQDGLKNLYRLVSYAHLDYFRTRPLIPKSLLSIYRGGLLLGSACEQGELFQALVHGADEEALMRVAAYYDYFEIMPLTNNAFMLREGIAPDEEALRAFNRRVVALGEKMGKPVVATGDVHFLEPEDSVFREVLMTKLGFSDADQQAGLYFKPTDEMLEEFSYLGEETARRVVITASNEIADLCEPLKPFPDGTHAPEIPNAENELRDMAVSTAHGIYGDPLPKIVEARLDKELHSIIGNGFASLYLMAQRLVYKSLSDGYLVGSRGSVGSSFVATMAGITEVNPLQPHYVCPKCKHSDFDVDRSLYACGADMPDRDCPACGTKYKKEGFDIPFEVFLGFKGDKTPDIDLNFSGEYQPVAHKYVEEMFGVGHAFRAGTISGIAERKADELVEGYALATGKLLRRAEKKRLSNGCLDVKVTTGQHPGGIVIVPKHEDILDFTPIQYPADKKDKNTITTHFDFHAMDDRLVKLDILGHDDPTALRMLEDITGVNPRGIPLDDADTMGIFSSPAPLKIDLSGMNCSVGTLGVPEFGTGFVRTVLENTKPTSIEELIRIAGLTHGTDVWLNNAEPLVMNKIAKLSEVLCTRDDIMNYLIAHGMEASISFKIMESVRKGRGLTPEMEQALEEGKIADWFVDSCKKIKYMFPRGHAVAYAMMSFRIAYFKVHEPLAFYAVYYTVRADAFDVTRALGGAARVLKTIKELERGMQSMEFAERKKVKELITILEVVYEMNLRGIELLPVDLYRSEATRFTIENGVIRPPFNSIPTVGATAAETLVQNRGNKRFLSVEAFQKRTGTNSAVAAKLRDCGCFAGLPETNQISLFSLDA